MADTYDSGQRAGVAPAPSAWEQSLQQSVQHVFAAQQLQQPPAQQQQQQPAQAALPQDPSAHGAAPSAVPATDAHATGHAGYFESAPRAAGAAPRPSHTSFNAAMDAATGLAAGGSHGMHALQQRVDADAGGFAVTLSARTHALLFNPIATYAVSWGVLWLVLFVCLVLSSPGFVQERVEAKDGSVRYVLSLKRAAVFAIVLSALCIAVPAVYTRVRARKSAPAAP